jgi:signal transduction histidine kinase
VSTGTGEGTGQREPAGQRFESLGRLTGGMAHDVNNLLAVVILTADRLLAGPVPEDKRPVLLGNIRLAAAAAAEMTAQLLTLSRTAAAAERSPDPSARPADAAQV